MTTLTTLTNQKQLVKIINLITKFLCNIIYVKLLKLFFSCGKNDNFYQHIMKTVRKETNDPLNVKITACLLVQLLIIFIHLLIILVQLFIILVQLFIILIQLFIICHQSIPQQLFARHCVVVFQWKQVLVQVTGNK